MKPLSREPFARRLALIFPLFLLIPLLAVFGQSPARELRARLSTGHVVASPDQPPQVRAELALSSGDDEHLSASRITFRGMTLNAPHLTTGDFEVTNEAGDRLFEGRWVAAAFRAGATSISLEGAGHGPYAATKLKLKLKARVETNSDSPASLSGEGEDAIRPSPTK